MTRVYLDFETLPTPRENYKWVPVGGDCPCSGRCCDKPDLDTKGCLKHLPECDEYCDENWAEYCHNCKTKCGCGV